MSLRRTWRRLLALGQSRRLDRELDDEIRAHLELAEHDARAAGLPPGEGRRRFGPVEPIRELHRDRRSLRWLDTFLRDVRYSVASLRHQPAFAAIVIGILALGIGANAAMFSLVDAVLLRPLPFPNPDRIVALWQAPRPGVSNATSTLDFEDWRRLNRTFDAMAAEETVSVAMTGSGEPRRLAGKAVTRDYFTVFGARAERGRLFTADDDQPGADPILIVSHRTFTTVFGADPDALQRGVVLDGRTYRMVGVLEPGPFDRDPAAFWTPLLFTPEEQTRSWHWLTVFGRLRPGVTLDRAQSDMDRVNGALAESTSVLEKNWTIVVRPFAGTIIDDNLRRSVAVAFGAVLMMLLIACANVTNLLLVRNAARKKEMAVRAALGATRSRLIVQLLTDSCLLCLLGGIAGLGLAALLLRAAGPLVREALPPAVAVHLDGRVVGFAVLAAAIVALGVGTLPALQGSFGRLAQAMSDAHRGTSAARAAIRRVVVIAEVSLSLVLVCGAVLLFRSLLNLQRTETGVRLDHEMTTSVALPEASYPTPERAALFYTSTVERLAAAPGIVQAGLGTELPLRWIGNGEGLWLPGVTDGVHVRFKRVDPGYFKTFDIPIVSGRGFTAADRAGSTPVVIVNRTLARQIAEVGGLTNPIGQFVRSSRPSYRAKNGEIVQAQIIGVIRDEQVASPGSPDPPVLYAPLAQTPSLMVDVIVRTQSDPELAAPAIRDAIRHVDPNLPVGEFQTMGDVREGTLSNSSRPAWLIGAFAAVAALLAALGLYGVLAHTVGERRREIGIRLALGARPRAVLVSVLANALTLTAIGLVLGLAGTLAFSRFLASLLFGVSPLDPIALTTACAIMIAIGALAAAVPAARATRVNPVGVLREE